MHQKKLLADLLLKPTSKRKNLENIGINNLQDVVKNAIHHQ